MERLMLRRCRGSTGRPTVRLPSGRRTSRRLPDKEGGGRRQTQRNFERDQGAHRFEGWGLCLSFLKQIGNIIRNGQMPTPRSRDLLLKCTLSVRHPFRQARLRHLAAPGTFATLSAKIQPCNRIPYPRYNCMTIMIHKLENTQLRSKQMAAAQLTCSTDSCSFHTFG